jgi:hypothetical protein
MTPMNVRTYLCFSAYIVNVHSKLELMRIKGAIGVFEFFSARRYSIFRKE